MSHPAPVQYVLAVDDDAEHLQSLRTVLEGAGFRVIAAADFAQARKRLSEGSYDILVLEMRLPDGDGLDLLSLAKEMNPHAVTIFLTRDGSVESAISSLRHGAYDHLVKPCPTHGLLASVRRAAEKQRLAQALSRRTEELETLNRSLDRRVQDATRQIFLLNERLKRFVRDLIEAGEARIRLMENVAHELKTPLSVVRGYASLLSSRPREQLRSDDAPKILDTIAKSSDTLHALLEELTQAIRLSTRKVQLRREELDAWAEMRDAAEAFRLQAEGKGVSLTCGCPEGPGPGLQADRVRLRQILSNLISNALKFTPSGGGIVLWAKPADSHVHFCVEDTGPGIPERQRARIFERFYQADAAQAHKGLGLGLEITRGLVRLHGGDIWVESEEGKGARFHFLLPMEPADESSSHAGPAAASTPLPGVPPPARAGAP